MNKKEPHKEKFWTYENDQISSLFFYVLITYLKAKRSSLKITSDLPCHSKFHTICQRRKCFFW